MLLSRLGAGKRGCVPTLSQIHSFESRTYSAASSKIFPTVGQTFETEEIFGKDRVAQFVSVTGDANILHADPDDDGSELQGEVRIGSAIIPGSMCAAMFPAIIGTAFPGALYMSQTLKFRNPALVGSRVRAEVTVEKVSGTRVSFNTVCRLVAPPPTPLLDFMGGQPDIVMVDGKALALLQGWKPNEGGA